MSKTVKEPTDAQKHQYVHENFTRFINEQIESIERQYLRDRLHIANHLLSDDSKDCTVAYMEADMTQDCVLNTWLPIDQLNFDEKSPNKILLWGHAKDRSEMDIFVLDKIYDYTNGGDKDINYLTDTWDTDVGWIYCVPTKFMEVAPPEEYEVAISKQKPSDDFLVADSPLPALVKNALMRSDIKTVGHIRQCSQQFLKLIRNIGERSIRYIEEFIGESLPFENDWDIKRYKEIEEIHSLVAAGKISHEEAQARLHVDRVFSD